MTIAQQQCGFRKYPSTETSFLKLTDDYPLNMNKGLKYGLFLALEKAFDTVNHQIFCLNFNFMESKEVKDRP